MTANTDILNPVTPIYQGAILSAANPLPVTSVGIPAAGTIISGNSTGSTGAVVGTLAGAAAKTTYINGFTVSAIGGTAPIGPITVAGLVTASQVYYLNSSAAGVTLVVNFQAPIPASAVNTPITVTTTADGTATAVSVNSWGFQL